MLGKAFIPPAPCSICDHTVPVEFRDEEVNVFESCFGKHLGSPSAPSNHGLVPDSHSSSAKKPASMDGDTALFDDFLFDFHDEFSPVSSNEGSSGSSNSNGGTSTPATEISPMSPTKFGELDLDGFTPGAPTFPMDPVDKMPATTTCALAPNSDSYRRQSSSARESGAITPGKTVLEPVVSPQQFYCKQEILPTQPGRPNLTINPPQQHQRRIPQAGQPAPMDHMDDLIDPALTSYETITSASVFASPSFSQPPSALPSAIEPPSATSTKAPSSREEPVQKESKSTPKRKRTRKPAPSSPADAEKQARFLERNRNAASRCRARRKAQNDRLEQRAGELERERDTLRVLQQSLISEKAELLGRVLDLECEESCCGAEGLGSLGTGQHTCKPPRDLLVSALGELVMSSAADAEMEDDELEAVEQEQAVA